MHTNDDRLSLNRRSILKLPLGAAVLASPFAALRMQSAAAQDVTIETRVQILHASPDLGKVEVHINYDEVLDEFTYGKLSDWKNIDPGSNRVTITEDRAGFNYAVFDAMYPVPAGNDYYLIITDALIMTSVVDRTPILDGAARVRFVQSSVDLPPVDVNATGQKVTFATELTYVSNPPYTSVPAGTYDVDVTLSDSGDSVFTQTGIVLDGNQVYDLVIMGQPGNEDKPLEIMTLSDTTTSQVATPTA